MLSKLDTARFDQVMADFEPADNFERELALGILQRLDHRERFKESVQEVEMVFKKTTNDRNVSS